MATPSTISVEDDLKQEVSSPEPRQLPAEAQKQDVQPEKFEPGWRFIAVFSSLCILTLMAALDATSLSVALPIMARALGGSAVEAFKNGTSFLLTSTVFQPVIGSFSHIFGRK
ncbi:hypothetical protein NX059_003748 [Plenodomus lindquistii]|nr:hypothetical protein NX059_003748 [Plenodomus lindquistii]